MSLITLQEELSPVALQVLSRSSAHLGYLIRHHMNTELGVDMCGVGGKRRLCDLNVTSFSPPLAKRHIRSYFIDINHLNTIVRENKAEKNNVVNEQETIQNNIKCRYRRPSP